MKVHHFGIIVRDIKSHIDTYFKTAFAPTLSLENLTPIIHDPIQKVRVAFLELEGGRLELVEPASDDSPVSNLLKEKIALYHHVCFEVADLDAQLDRCRQAQMVILSPPQPAIAFNGRRISFVLGRDRLLWELLEANPHG